MSLVVIFGVIAAVLSVPAVIDLVRRADLRRIGVRNIVRRPTESILIIVGSALGTAIIVAALMVGDTFDHSIRDIARTDLGEIDQTFEFERPDQLAAGYAAVTGATIDGVDGVASVRMVQVAAAGAGTGDTRAVEPSVLISAFDFDQIAGFGNNPSELGLVGHDGSIVAPTTEQIVINSELAEDLNVGISDDVSLFVAAEELVLEVVGVVDASGLGGYSDAFISIDLADVADPTGAQTFDHLIVSNTGGVFDSIDATDQVTDDVLAVLMPLESTVGEVGEFDIKRDLLEDAEEEGKELTRIFSVVGGFSVLAGILLLINLFVMLAEERKPNLGVLRAVGWKRSALRRAFRAEGVIYSTIAATLGAVMGIGVGWVVVRVTQSIFTGVNPDSDFELLFTVRPGSLLTAGLVGLIIAMGAIWFTSWRISRLNIISAIRDLPDPKTKRSRILVFGFGALAVAIGALMLAAGLSTTNAFLSIISVPIAIMGIAMIAKDFITPTVVGGAAGLITVLWGIFFFPLMPADMTSEVDIAFFLLFGVIIVAGGVALTTVLGPSFQKLFTRGNRPMVEARVAMAYPSARLFRTAASLAMYSLIIFSLAFMAVLSNGISGQSAGIAEDTAAGHDIYVRSNASNPIDPTALTGSDGADGVDGVTIASPVIRDAVRFYADFEPGSEVDPEYWGMVGIEPDFATIGSPKLQSRADRFDSDQQALAAVANDPSLIIVPTWFLGDEDGFEPIIGSTVTAVTNQGTTDFELIGVTENDFAFSGPWLAASAVRDLAPEARANRIYVGVEPGADAKAIASTIESRFLTNGAEAETFTDRVQRIIEVDLGFFSLLQGYLLLGLVIGIAGLAVSLFRAVRERRRQIGMLRAMGLSHSGVRRWFLTEATFISLMGIITGVGLGLVTGYLVATKSSAFDGSQLPFSIPWATVAFIIAIPFAASALAAIVPARTASKLLPAEALRLAD